VSTVLDKNCSRSRSSSSCLYWVAEKHHSEGFVTFRVVSLFLNISDRRPVTTGYFDFQLQWTSPADGVISAMSRLSFISLIAALLCILPHHISSLPTEVKSDELETVASDDERRATWLDTRDLKENFKDLVYLSMQELASEGLVNPDAVLSKPQEKRGRHQGFCFRKTKSGRFLPYICWKDGDQDEK